MKTAAVIGCGRPAQGKVGWAQGHAQARGLLEAYPDVELHGVDINEENLKLFGDTFNLPKNQLHLSTDALYNSAIPDVVGIATWPALHCPQVHEAAWKGVRGILCEKPLAVDNGEIDRMLEVCNKRDVKMAVAHQRRHEPKFRLARKLIQEGRFGEKIVLHARLGDNWDILSWTVHWFDMANFFFGEHPNTILGGVHFDGEERYKHAVESSSVIFAEYSGDRQAIFTTGPAPLVDFGFMIEGDKAFGRFVDAGLRLYTENGSEIIPLPEAEMGAYAHVCRELGEAVENGSPMVCDAADCAWATRMAFAAHESAAYQRKVTLPSPVKFPPLEILRNPPERPQTGRKVTLLADNHHKDPETGLSTRDGVISALEALGDTVKLVDVTQRAVTAEDLDDAELLLICHTQFESTEETREIVGNWMRESRPTVIVHCGIGAWPDWQELRERTGYYWIWPESLVPADAGKKPSGHPFVACDIQIADADRISLGWTRAWLPVDEVYRDLAEGDPVDLLAVTELEGSRQPIAWQNRQHPHITAWLPGHRPDVWELPVMRDGLNAMCELAKEGASSRSGPK